MRRRRRGVVPDAHGEYEARADDAVDDEPHVAPGRRRRRSAAHDTHGEDQGLAADARYIDTVNRLLDAASASTR